MATSTPRRRTPPVNAELYKLERSGARIWTGSAPAFATRSQEWVPTSTGAALPVGEYTVTVPILMGPAEGEPDDPDFPVDPDEVPPPPPPAGEGENPYAPPDEIPEVAEPDAGTYQEALADRPGYVPAASITLEVPTATGTGLYGIFSAGPTIQLLNGRAIAYPSGTDPEAVTGLHIHRFDGNNEWFEGLVWVVPGDTFHFEDPANADKWCEYTVSAIAPPPVYATDPPLFEVSFADAGTIPAGFADWSGCELTLVDTGTPVEPPETEQPFRPRFYIVDGRDTWEYDVSQGGLHYSFGAGDAGIVDRTGNGRHGSPIAVTLGSTAGKLANGDESTYFNGVNSRIVTPWDPFEDFGLPAGPVPDESVGPLWYDPSSTGLTYNNPSSPGTGPDLTDGAERVVQITGWARRQDRSNGHLLFSHTGMEGPRCWAAANSNDVCLALMPQHRTALSERINCGGWWPNAWPADDQWTHFLIEIREPGGIPPRGPLPPGQALGPGTYEHYHYVYGWDRRTTARLWINGVRMGDQQIANPSGQIYEPASGVNGDWISLNQPVAVALPPDPDREPDPWPWIGPNGEDCRALLRGNLMVSGIALPVPTPELYPDLFDWDYVAERIEAEGGIGSNGTFPYYGEFDLDDRPERINGGGLWREGRRASAWKGSIDEFAVHKYEQRVTPVDLGIRPASSAWPGPTLPALVATDPEPPGLFAASTNAPAVTPATVVDVPEGQVQVIPRVGDRAYWRHAGQTFAKTIDGIEEREDYGFYRLFSRRGE